MAATLTSKASSLLQANSDEGDWAIGHRIWAISLEVANDKINTTKKEYDFSFHSK